MVTYTHLKRLLAEFIRYYHEDRVHDALNKETPAGRVRERRQTGAARVVGGAARRWPASALSLADGRLKRVPLQAVASSCAVPSYAVKVQGVKPVKTLKKNREGHDIAPRQEGS